MGINTTAHKLAMFVLGGAIAGLAGGLEAHITFMVAPAGYGFGRVVDMLVFAMVGGIAHFFGPVIGAAFLTLLPELLRELSRLTGVQAGPLRMFVNGAVLLRRHHLPAQRARVAAGALPRVAQRAEGARCCCPLRAWPRLRRRPRRGRRQLRVGEGEVHGLIGPNGAGKTTLLNLVSGLLRPTSGGIVFGGERDRRLPPHRIAALGLTRTFQNIRLFAALSAADNVLVGQHLRRVSPLWRRMVFLSAATHRGAGGPRLGRWRSCAASGSSNRADEKAGHLSYGEQRRVEIARALGSEPRVLLLDEPTAGMNPAEVQSVAELIREMARSGHSVLLVEHNVPLVMSVCDRVTVLNFGKVIADGAPAEVTNSPAVIDAYLGTQR